MPCLFFVEVFLLFLSKLEAGKYISIGIAFVLMGLSCLYFRIIDYKMPWRADIAISILPLVMLAQALCGGFLKFTEQRNLKMDCLLAILAFTMSLSIIWFDVKINLFAYQYPTPFYLLYICPLGGILLFTIASKYIRSQIMEYIGKNSLTIMLVHEPIKRIVIKVVSVCTGLDMEQVRSQILYVAIITLFTLCISLLLCLFINRYAPWMVSKNKQIP